jgi:hypothetical protein
MTAMAEFERTTTVGVGADAAYAFFADPLRIPDYVPTMAHVETIAVDGGDSAEPDPSGHRDTDEARFFTDGAARRVEWGRPGTEYAGSITVAQGTASTCQVTIRLHTRDDVDAAGVDRMLDEALRNIRRAVSGR